MSRGAKWEVRGELKYEENFLSASQNFRFLLWRTFIFLTVAGFKQKILIFGFFRVTFGLHQPAERVGMGRRFAAQ